MRRVRLLFVMTFLAAVTALFWGIEVTNAEPDSSSANKDLGVQSRESSAATRARAQRAELLKRRREAKKQLEKVIEERQRPQTATGADVAAPDKADKGVPQ